MLTLRKMKDNGKSKSIEKIILVLLWTGAVLVSIKSIFTDFGADGAYQVAMSYRHISGDALLLKMWEPHQTSVFLNDILLFVYRLFVPSLTGAVIYIQIMGTLLFALIGYFIYRNIREYTGEFIANAAWIFFIVFRAKQVPTIEFANLEIAAAAVAFILLLRFIKGGERSFILPLIALSVFFQILSYPTCILSAVSVVLFMIFCTENRLKNILIFIASLAVFGLSFALYFVIKIGPALLIRIVKNVFLSDTHSTFKFGGYWNGFLIMVGAAFACAAVGIIISFVFKLIRSRQSHGFPDEIPKEGAAERFKEISAEHSAESGIGNHSRKPAVNLDVVSVAAVVSAAIFTVLELVMLILQKRTGADWMCSIYIIPFVLLLIGLFGIKKLDRRERKVYLAGILLSASSFFATMMLTDLGMITIVAYLILAAMVSFIPISRMIPCNKAFITLILLAVLFHRGIVIWGIGNTNGRVHMIWEAQNFIRQGPAAGVVCDHFNKAYTDTNIEEFKAVIQPDDKIFFVGEDLMDSLVYVYSGAEISNYSTIDTPLYNECLEEYFEINPEKKPTLIASASWFGSSSIPEDSYIMQWIRSNYSPVYEGSYWTFWR